MKNTSKYILTKTLFKILSLINKCIKKIIIF